MSHLRVQWDVGATAIAAIALFVCGLVIVTGCELHHPVTRPNNPEPPTQEVHTTPKIINDPK